MAESYLLLSERDRRMALAAVTRANLDAGMEVRIVRKRKNREQEKRLHAMLNDISNQIGWPPDTGELHPIEFWKRALTLGWCIHEAEERAAQGDYSGERPQIIISLDGKHMALFLPGTSDLDVDQYARLITYVEVEGQERGVVWTEPKRDDPPPAEDWR